MCSSFTNLTEVPKSTPNLHLYRNFHRPERSIRNIYRTKFWGSADEQQGLNFGGDSWSMLKTGIKTLTRRQYKIYLKSFAMCPKGASTFPQTGERWNSWAPSRTKGMVDLKWMKWTLLLKYLWLSPGYTCFICLEKGRSNMLCSLWRKFCNIVKQNNKTSQFLQLQMNWNKAGRTYGYALKHCFHSTILWAC